MSANDTDLRSAGLKAMREALPGVFPDGDLDLIAPTNGLTRDEIAEVIYHATGFPRAVAARTAAREALAE
jgi:hypothetical protein